MAVDPRQVLAGFLTLTMFAMLGNMIKRDHFDSVDVNQSNVPNVPYDDVKSEHSLVTFPKGSNGPWKEDGLDLKPCWTTPNLDEAQQSEGFITFSLTNGPEYHVSQIADAVVVARYLGATLVLPDIRGSNPGDKRNFEDIYDVEKFLKSLDGVVRVTKDQPAEISARNLAVVRVPNRVTEDHIQENIEPIFRKGNIRLATYFPSVNMRKTTQKSNSDSVACLAMFGTLELQPEVREVVDSMVERLRALSRKSDGQFIAVDLRVDILEKKGCQGSGTHGMKSCYSPQEVALFLRNIGFDKDTTVYLTQSRWDGSLDALKDFFPKTYTKEGIMPVDKKDKFLNSEASEFEKVIDFYMCSQSDVFVPALSGLFYANVAGKRIASGRSQILVPADISGSKAPAADFISPYISKKNHLAYSCFC
ncbi:protein MANNAN SYNTHESIS-RELATED 1-like [Cornus florida]|uniref:protein MANNAN SYNTHESIS-RELATED 1-like n=1 Tax=Cornus florida TaxID=4283 RepID=UPI00289DB250|nr:protein MANNAN SYNTHESIS-RELATED 1-like [Cornus florida]